MTGPTALPTGTVTFLFTDIEGSTRLVQALGDRWPAILEEHRTILRSAWEHHAGIELLTEGDSFMVVFRSAREAVAAAVAGQRDLQAHAWPEDARIRVRMGMHTGEATLGAGSYVGLDVHRAARIAAAGHGGQILLSDSTRALVDRVPLGDVSLRDLGSHRLKDLLAPERIHQVDHPELDAEFPPLATLSTRPNNLPTLTSAFVGRGEELALIRHAFTDGGRLVTLTGPGGIGKTRLALQAAAELSSGFVDGLFFVDLAPIRDAGLAFEAVVRATGEARTDDPALEQLERQLASKLVLLVLDNLEQVIEFADGVVAMIQRCPTVHVLVTSREALHVRGERVIPIPPLGLPDLSARGAGPLDSDAMRLFLERARESEPTFAPDAEQLQAITEICARLDGLPLAIELAAARLTLFSPAELAARLRDHVDALGRGARDLPERHRTIQATIEWSYELLDPEEQAIFRLFSVFPSGRPGDVEAVAQAVGVDTHDVLDSLESLVDKSLIRAVGSDRRLTMLGVIREFATQRLREDPLAAAIERAHAERFATFASQFRDQVHGADREAALERVETELDNVLASWRYWIDVGELERLDLLLDALWVLHDARSWYTGALELTNGLLDVLSRSPSSPERAIEEITVRTSLARGLMAVRGYTPEVEATYRRALELAEEVGGIPQRIPVLRSLVSLDLYRGDFEEGLAVARQLRALAEQQGDAGLRAEGELRVGTMLMSLGDAAAAVTHLRRAVELFDPTRHVSGRFRLGPSPAVVPHTTLAFILWLTGYPDQAHDHLRQALHMCDRLGQPYSLAYAGFHAGLLHAWERRWDRVEELASQVLLVADHYEFHVWKATALVLKGLAVAAAGRHDEAVVLSDQGIGLYRDMTAPPVFWPFLLGLRARTLARVGRVDDGLETTGAAITMIATIGSQQPNVLAPQFPILRGDLLAQLGDATGAEESYLQAIEIAHLTGARMNELQGWLGMARISAGGSETTERLRALVGTFTEGLDAADVVAAGNLLDSEDTS